jgi:NADH-quinone oxidoreductase subunit N
VIALLGALGAAATAADTAAKNPHVDWFAIAPETVLTATIVIVLVADLLLPRRDAWQTSRIASIGVLVSLGFVAALYASDTPVRSLFGGAYVVDDYALVFKGLFLVATYITILLAVDYIGEGDYYQGEFYFLLLISVLGMSTMSSARDLVTIFVALETISVPTYVLAGWRKHDRRSNEAAIKYYLIGAISSAVMLYGMSLIYGVSGTTLLSGIADGVKSGGGRVVGVAIFLSLIGFAFKVSAVPFHWWAPDTYEGAPTPVTAFLSVASKAGGFVALLNVIFFGFSTRPEAWWGVVMVLAIASMTLGNLTALRQTNIVRMLAYSSIAQGGFMLVPFAAYGIARDHGNAAAESSSFTAVVVYLLVYGAMNLGAFACVIAVARRTRSAEITTYRGLFTTSPAIAVVMSMFLASLTGIPPLAGWFAKFVMFRSAVDAGTWAGITLAVVAGVNSVIAAYYYLNVVRTMWFEAPAEAAKPVQVPAALGASIAICTALTLVVGIYPQLFAHLGDLAAKAVAAAT